ncbi:MAG: HAMP domain-containing histidine kinase, partial [Deltaproteobacteria bacterium]|nr:HAMP domain-containing histidine kinase [Deltaproteobacteria bacterium]
MTDTATRTPVDPAALINLRWIVRLRWGAVLGQVVTILAGRYFVEVPLPTAALITVCAIVGLFNLVVQLWMLRGGSPSVRTCGLNLLGDVAALTALLALSGGVSNPFSALYLVHITIAAVILPERWSLLLALAGVSGYSGLVLAGIQPLKLTGADPSRTLLWGAWAAFLVAAAFISIFSYRMSQSLHTRERELMLARADAEGAERLAALGTLAAGTAHELNTPLGTIAILAGELADQLEGDRKNEAQEIRKQVRRCKEIVTSMLAPRGGQADEEPTDVELAPALESVVKRWKAGRPGPEPRLVIANDTREAKARLPAIAFDRALANLLDNAAEATQGRAQREVRVNLLREDGLLRVSVADNGVGVPEALRYRVGEPFFTTKGPGRGSGLGLYLARHVVERQGGSMKVLSEEGRGTEVVLI